MKSSGFQRWVTSSVLVGPCDAVQFHCLSNENNMEVNISELSFQWITMPSACIVPKCNRRGGHKFSSDPEMWETWVTTVKWIDEVTGKNWTPSKTGGGLQCALHARWICQGNNIRYVWHIIERSYSFLKYTAWITQCCCWKWDPCSKN